MTQKIFIKRYSKIIRVFHFWILLAFLNQAVTGFSRLFIATAWGRRLTSLFGGKETSLLFHKIGGALMIAGFLVHIIYLLTKIDRRNLKNSVFGPDSIVPNLKDIQHLWQRILSFFGLGAFPKLDRWAYWEKFGYWGVFWGIPVLGITGLMLIYPLETSRILPGWSLNIAALLHRAEAILAISFVFIVHFMFGHLSPSKFPMNEAMFSGSVALEELMEEKPNWVKRLKQEGKIELAQTKPPATWFRVLYFIFGYAALAWGFYIMIGVIVYSSHARLH